ncbi:acyltransferase [Neptunomonas phycophila]|uniref:acyltransferase n=1 Tax=Neptunomonas phycophila TaxID=1572645 RepID=UPI0026E26576|nr:acyltransferase [Neptunomonas phycophila]MDO6467280.1 acyltransferase [Neptunomonas phycophila]
MNKLNSNIIAFKAIAIILVVFIHVSNGIKQLDYNSDQRFNVLYILLQASLFAVPVFFFLSGYLSFLNRKLFTWDLFLKPKMIRILFPYLLWSLFSYLVLYRIYEPLVLVEGLLLAKASGPYYFIFVLFFFLLVSPIINSLLSDKMLVLIGVVNFLFILFVCYLRVVTEDFKWQWAALHPLSWIFYFFFGAYIGKFGKGVFENLKLKWAALLVLFTFLLSVFEGYVVLSVTGLYWGGSSIKASSFFYSTSVLIFFVCLLDKKIQWNPVFLFLGSASFGIYLIHEIFRYRVEKLLDRIVLYVDHPYLYSFFDLMLTVLCSVVLIVVVRSILGFKRASKYLGF